MSALALPFTHAPVRRRTIALIVALGVVAPSLGFVGSSSIPSSISPSDLAAAAGAANLPLDPASIASLLNRTDARSVTRSEPTGAPEVSGGAALATGSIRPLFEANAGQFDPAVDFVVRGAAATVFIADGAMTYDVSDGDRSHAVQISLARADPDVVPKATGRPGPSTSYFLGADASNWISGATTTSAIEYENIVDGIGIRYLGTDAGLQYDLILDPGVDPSSAVLDIDGADDISIDSTGRLLVDVSVGEPLEFSAPITYQETAGGRVVIDSSYRMISNDQVSFAVGLHDPTLPLVIDPTLDLGTYVGTSGDDTLTDVVVDGSDNIVVVGSTTSATYPTTIGAYDRTPNGTDDIVVTKLNAAGTAIIWSTFIGGTGMDWANEMRPAADGDLLIAGYTRSADFPTTVGAYDRTHGGNSDVVVFELSANGTALNASTFLGGASNDVGSDLDAAPDGTVVVVGEVYSITGFPSTGGAYDTTKSGTDTSADGFVAKLSADLSTLSFSTYLGDIGDDFMESVDVTPSGTIYVSGTTTSAAMPTTAGSYDTTYNGSGDVWIGRLSSTGSTLEYGTFLGSTTNDVGPAAIQVGPSGLVYSASSAQNGFPTSPNAYRSTTTVADTALVVLDPAQSGAAQLVYGSFLGGTNGGWATDLAIDSDGRAYIVGDAGAPNLATIGAPDTTYAGGFDGMLAVVNPTSGSLEFLTYIGGANAELANGLALDSAQRPVVVGRTASTDVPTTSGAYDTTANGLTDGFIHRFTALGPPPVGGASGDLVMVTGDGAWGNALDAAYRSFFVGLGWSVTAIDDDAVQGIFDAAAAANDAMLVMRSTSPSIATKLQALAIGIVNAREFHWQELQYNSGLAISSAPGTQLQVVDTSHPITAGLTLGPLTVHTTSSTIDFWNSGGAPLVAGAQVLAERVGTPTNDGLVVFEQGSALGAGQIAADRRVLFPLGRTAFANLTTDALTLLARSVVWAAQSPLPLEPVVLDDIQKGTATITAGTSSATATIATVDPTKAFLTYTIRGNNTDASNIAITGVLANATTVTFSRAGTVGNVSIEWSVVEFTSGVTVQRGSTTLAATTTDIPITAVDLGRTFTLMNSRSTGTPFGANDLPRSQLTSATNLRLSVPIVGANVVQWQVVTYNDANVQRGTSNLVAGATSATATVASVDTAKSWLVYNTSTADGTAADIGQKLVRGLVTNATTLTFDRNNTGQTMDISWELVQFTGTTTVQRGSAAFGTAALTSNVAISSVTPSRTVVVGGANLFGGRSPHVAASNPGVGWFTTRVTSPTNVQITRDFTGSSAADLGWFAITWPGPAAPHVVNSTGDAIDALAGDGYCSTGGVNSTGVSACTLRAAIEEANALPGADSIRFAMPTADAGHSAGVWTITPASSLPSITGPVNIVATTQPGTVVNTTQFPDPMNGTLTVALSGVSVPFGLPGLSLTAGSSGSTIRGLSITGHAGAAAINVSNSGNNVIAGNHLGVTPAGTGVAANQFGVFISAGATSNRIGGALAADRNVIAGNSFGQIGIAQPATANNVVQGNEIGIRNGGVVVGPGGAVGILTSDGANGTLVGGTAPGTGNRISGAAMGIRVETPANAFVAVVGNHIWGNPSGLGIDIAPLFAVNANDAGDGDTGPNNLLNHPVITSAVAAGGTVNVTYDLDVPPNTDQYRIEFFSNPSGADPSGFGEGQIFVGAVTASPGTARTFSFPGAPGAVTTATATSITPATPNGFTATSEFSAAIIATGANIDSDGDGLWNHQEDANNDADYNPATNPGPDTDGDALPDYLDADDDGDTLLTSAENADPNGDGDPRDARDFDRDGQPDYLDAPTALSTGRVADEQKISDSVGGLAATVDDNDRFGRSVASIGDVDGDGVVDIAVGAHGDDDGGPDRGAVHILFLNPDGSVRAEQKISSTTGGMIGPLDDNDAFGMSATGIGDLDGDGIPDIVVGARLDDDGGNNRGAVYVLFLNRNGTVRTERKISSTTGGLGPLSDDDSFGVSATGIGDLDGDGTRDVAVGAHNDGVTNRGAVHVLFLRPDGTVRAQQKINDTQGGLVGNLDANDSFGYSVAGVGDLDVDGTPDLAVGAIGDGDGGSGGGRGAVYVLFLDPGGTVKDEQKISSTQGGLSGPLDDNDVFGYSAAGVGDLDADGTPDLAIGAIGDGDGGGGRGAVYVLFLDPDGTVKDEQKISSTRGGLTGPLDNDDSFGSSSTSLGDLDGDGSIDLAIGAFLDDDGGSDRGAVYVLFLEPDPIVVVNSTGGAADLLPGDRRCDTGGTNSAGRPECTLRAAISQVDASSGHVGIEFDIPTSDPGHTAGVWRITPLVSLPTITTTMSVDATTQPGFTSTPVIEIYGGGTAADGFLLGPTSNSSTIRGFAMGGFASNDIEVRGNDHLIAGNHFGVTADGVTPFPIGTTGTSLRVEQGTGTTIGGASPGDGNVITDSGAAGITVVGGDHQIRGNSIFANAGIGIDIGADGVTTPDPGDVDGILNQPLLLGAVESANTSTVTAVLDVPVGDYIVEYFDNPGGADPSGYGEGEQLVVAVPVSVTSTGGFVIRHVVPGTGSELTATATSVSASTTSEFSNAIISVPAATVEVLDVSTRRSDLVSMGGAPTTISGPTGPAFELDGVGDMYVGPALDVTDDDLELRSSVRLDSTVGNPVAISKRATSGLVIYELGVDTSSGSAVASVRLSGTSYTVSGGALSTGSWHQLEAVWDGTDLILYVDGTEVDRVAAAGTLDVDVATRMVVGARDDGTRRLDGAIDNVYVGHDPSSADAVAVRHTNLVGPSMLTVGAEQTSSAGSWTTTSAQSRSGSSALSAPTTTGTGSPAWAVARDIDEPGLVFESWWWISQSSDLDVASGTRAGSTPVDQYSSGALDSPFRWALRQRLGDSVGVDATTAGTPVTGAWFEVEMWTDQAGGTRLLIDGTEVIGWTAQGNALTSGSAGLLVNRLPVGQNWYVDDARARKLVMPEPVSSVGALDRQ